MDKNDAVSLLKNIATTQKLSGDIQLAINNVIANLDVELSLSARKSLSKRQLTALLLEELDKRNQ